MTKKTDRIQSSQALERHRRKCVICRHPHRDAIDEEFIHWRSPWEISRQYKISDYRSIYRHARATGILIRRRENFHSALDSLVEAAEEAKVTGDCVIRAIRAYSCLDSRGRWVDPPTQVNFSTAPASRPLAPPAQASPVLDIAETETEPESESEPDPEPDPESNLLTDDQSDAGSDVGAPSESELEPEFSSSAPENPPVRDLDLIYRTAIRNGLNALKT
ncbi:MAG: hypothetical protein WB987_13525 [Candidatus Acidiferrales bacterium]